MSIKSSVQGAIGAVTGTIIGAKKLMPTAVPETEPDATPEVVEEQPEVQETPQETVATPETRVEEPVLPVAPDMDLTKEMPDEAFQDEPEEEDKGDSQRPLNVPFPSDMKIYEEANKRAMLLRQMEISRKKSFRERFLGKTSQPHEEMRDRPREESTIKNE